MRWGLIKGLLLTFALFTSAAVLRAEVKTEEKNQFKMEGMMGRMMGMFGGKAAKEGTTNTVSVKGDRKMTSSESSGEIIDLSEQKIYSLDFKKKNYEVMTFEEMRRRMQESREKAAKAAKDNSKDNSKEQKPPADQQMEFDFSLKESGQKRTINSYDCREVVMTITGHEKGKTLEESGGMVITSHIWIGPSIPAVKEIADFDQRYAKALGELFNMGASAEQMNMAMAMYPGMKDMMGKMQVESVNMEGTQILTETTMESVRSAAQAQQQASQDQKKDSESSGGIPSIRGLGGMLGRGLGKKKEPESDPNKPTNRSTIFTQNHELLKVATSVSDADVAVPAGFKEKK